MSAPDGDDYTWLDDGRRPAADGRLTAVHVAAMERVVGLWPYPTMVAVGVLAEVLGFVKAAVQPAAAQQPTTDDRRPTAGGGGWDWREEFGALEPEGCYECDQ